MLLGNKLEIHNNDPYVHNVIMKGTSGFNKDFHQMAGRKDTFLMENREDPLKIACAIHPWMEGYIWVMLHDIFAVTDKEGTFTLPQVVPGDYDVMAWHEIYGEAECQKVTLVAGDVKALEFTFEKKSK